MELMWGASRELHRLAAARGARVFLTGHWVIRCFSLRRIWSISFTEANGERFAVTPANTSAGSERSSRASYCGASRWISRATICRRPSFLH